MNSLEKVLGTAKYAADYTMPGMLYGGVFRSRISHAYVKRLDLEKAKRMDGVVCVLDYRAIPGNNRFGTVVKDEPCLVDDKIRAFGDALVLVAAETKEILEDALEAIQVEYEEMKSISTIEHALDSEAPEVQEGIKKNIYLKEHLEHGEVDKAFDECDVIIENTYFMDRMTPALLEPEASMAYIDEDDILNVIASGQNSQYVKEEIADLLAISGNDIRIKQAVSAAESGVKVGISSQLYCALMAYHTKRPVKMVQRRHKFLPMSSGCHSMIITAKTGATKEGRILAAEINQKIDIGAYASYHLFANQYISMRMKSLHNVPNMRLDTIFIYTNNPPGEDIYEFGIPQISVVYEKQMDAIAEKLGIGNFTIRMMNTHTMGMASNCHGKGGGHGGR